MKLKLVAILAILLLASQAGAQGQGGLKSPKEKVSYSIGVDIGNTLKRQPIDVDPAVLGQGIKDAMSGGKLLLTEQEIRDTMQNFQKEMVTKQTERMKKLSEENKTKGETFLAENKKKPDIITLPSGLQYKVIKEGTGKMPKATDKVTVNYRGTLIDGTEFDSSFKRGEPASFQVNGVIAGWTEALQKMKTEAKWQLFIPSNLAYGERGAGNMIGPNATLIFDVELISIKEQK
ncbi:MAG: FKBP-type peptidyl-prolyl cis-trans isomerase [Syntrophobacterales bacterium]|jgi:FKBP-type peptidyl-prolyl cis-trans isomerase FklB|nr:FKBP-type peptidyl-prolyl cis-trans isomerase [Syntrophobacterales bacterium]